MHHILNFLDVNIIRLAPSVFLMEGHFQLITTTLELAKPFVTLRMIWIITSVSLVQKLKRFHASMH